jgi:hypothetical protein
VGVSHFADKSGARPRLMQLQYSCMQQLCALVRCEKPCGVLCRTVLQSMTAGHELSPRLLLSGMACAFRLIARRLGSGAAS